MSEAVHAMFSTIAPRYDLTNSILSLGVHHIWRSITVAESGATLGNRVLDCATGTGDLALAFKKIVGPSGYVLGTDFNADMLKTAPQKATAKGLEIHFEVADAMHLQYTTNSFDIASISFGIRNVDDPVVALAEMARVVKPGGKVVVLEFGSPKGLLGGSYRLYSKFIIPRIGGWLTGNKKAYEYLPSTAAAFPCGDDFLELMKKTQAFSNLRLRSLTGGVAFVYIGTVA